MPVIKLMLLCLLAWKEDNMKINLIIILLLVTTFISKITYAGTNKSQVEQNQIKIYDSSLKPYSAENTERLKLYIIRLDRKLRKNWIPAVGFQNRPVGVLFVISKEGSLLRLMLYRSSGCREVDDAALNAVKNSEPFEPFPPEYKEPTMGIQYKMDFNPTISQFNQNDQCSVQLKNREQELQNCKTELENLKQIYNQFYSENINLRSEVERLNRLNYESQQIIYKLNMENQKLKRKHPWWMFWK